MYTSDPIYKKPYKPHIFIRDIGKNAILYEYDPWTGSGTSEINGTATNSHPVHASVALSENHNGSWVLQIEDANMEMPVQDIGQGARLQINTGKQSTQEIALISGLVKKTGYSRGADNKVLYNLYGAGTSIRFSERVLYYVTEAAKSQSLDGLTLDMTDVTRYARALLKTGLTSETALGIITAATMDTDSEVRTWIASIAVEYGEAQDLINIIEEASGGSVYVDINDVVQLKHEIRTSIGGRGFTIKNEPMNISGANDDADDTCYLRGKSWSFEESTYKSDSYGNRNYSILAPTPDPDPLQDINLLNSPIQSNTQAMAQKFRPTHTHWLPGDIWLAIQAKTSAISDPTSSRGLFPPVIRICKDNGDVPLNTNGIVITINFQDQSYQLDYGEMTEIIFTNGPNYMINPAGTFVNEFELDTTKDYWMILHHSYTDPNVWFKWYRRSITGHIATNPTIAPSTQVNGGSGWTTTQGNIFWFAIPRRRSHPIGMWDPKAMYAIGSRTTARSVPVDTTLPTVPSFIKTREAWYKWMAYQLMYMARPRSNYLMPKISAPNVPILPGDTIVISDDVLGYSGPGNDFNLAKCGDMLYQWSDFGGRGDSSKPTTLNISPVGLPARYK